MTHDHRDVLLKAASCVEQGWCQDTLARSLDGKALSNPHDQEATQWCVVGALIRSMDELGLPSLGRPWSKIEGAIRRVIGRSDVVGWNNHPDRTQDEVATTLREAAEL